MSTENEKKLEYLDALNDRTTEVLQELVTSLSNEVTRLTRSGLRSCIACKHFELKKELCQHAAATAKSAGIGIRPPARVIALGCGNYDQAVPF